MEETPRTHLPFLSTASPSRWKSTAYWMLGLLLFLGALLVPFPTPDRILNVLLLATAGSSVVVSFVIRKTICFRSRNKVLQHLNQIVICRSICELGFSWSLLLGWLLGGQYGFGVSLFWILASENWFLLWMYKLYRMLHEPYTKKQSYQMGYLFIYNWISAMLLAAASVLSISSISHEKLVHAAPKATFQLVLQLFIPSLFYLILLPCINQSIIFATLNKFEQDTSSVPSFAIEWLQIDQQLVKTETIQRLASMERKQWIEVMLRGIKINGCYWLGLIVMLLIKCMSSQAWINCVFACWLALKWIGHAMICKTHWFQLLATNDSQLRWMRRDLMMRMLHGIQGTMQNTTTNAVRLFPEASKQIIKASQWENSHYQSYFTGNCIEVTETSQHGGQSGAMLFSIGSQNELMLKTISTQERCTYQHLVIEYAEYLKEHPQSLLVRIFGCYRVIIFEKPYYCIVMSNVFHQLHPQASIDERYDLKGSWENRLTEPNTQLPRNPFLVYKDQDLEHQRIRLSPILHAQLMDQMQQDSTFLAEQHIMDYSLLLGLQTTNAILPSFPSPLVGIVDDQPMLVYVGIVDIFQDWNRAKKWERWWKIWCQCQQSSGVSAIAPSRYVTRFQAKVHATFVSDVLV